jgi:hypothetical protein
MGPPIARTAAPNPRRLSTLMPFDQSDTPAPAGASTGARS